MRIHQVSVSYVAEQDRILARVNTASSEEMRLWLTRRLMMGLWPMLSRLLTSHLLKLEAAGTSLDHADEDLKRMLADFRKEQFLKEADFETPYKDQQAVLPLGDEPLLVTDVDAAPLGSGRLRLSFNERLPDAAPRSFQLELEPKLMQALMHLLEQALARSQWRDYFVGAADALEEEHPAGDGEAPPARKPRYLN
jgi:hypothetical protein